MVLALPSENLQLFAIIFYYNVLTSNPSRTSGSQDWQSVQLQNFNGTGLGIGDVNEAHYRSILEHSRPKNSYFGKFPESRTQTAGDRNIPIEPKKMPFNLKNIFSDSDSDMWSLILFKRFEKFDGQRKVKVPIAPLLIFFWSFRISTN